MPYVPSTLGAIKVNSPRLLFGHVQPVVEHSEVLQHTVGHFDDEVRVAPTALSQVSPTQKEEVTRMTCNRAALRSQALRYIPCSYAGTRNSYASGQWHPPLKGQRCKLHRAQSTHQPKLGAADEPDGCNAQRAHGPRPPLQQLVEVVDEAQLAAREQQWGVQAIARLISCQVAWTGGGE
jgi:hypothetical protein